MFPHVCATRWWFFRMGSYRQFEHNSQKKTVNYVTSANQKIWQTLKIQWYQRIHSSFRFRRVMLIQHSQQQNHLGHVDCQGSLFESRKQACNPQGFSMVGQLWDPSRKPRRLGRLSKFLPAFLRNQLCQNMLMLLRFNGEMSVSRIYLWGKKTAILRGRRQNINIEKLT